MIGIYVLLSPSGAAYSAAVSGLADGVHWGAAAERLPVTDPDAARIVVRCDSTFLDEALARGWSIVASAGASWAPSEIGPDELLLAAVLAEGAA